jgi:hypothetical protein
MSPLEIFDCDSDHDPAPRRMELGVIIDDYDSVRTKSGGLVAQSGVDCGRVNFPAAMFHAHRADLHMRARGRSRQDLDLVRGGGGELRKSDTLDLGAGRRLAAAQHECQADKRGDLFNS